MPSVPELHAVASVSVSFPSSTPSLLTSLLQSYGEVNWLGPVQITHVEEKPGALMVYWEEVNFELCSLSFTVNNYLASYVPFQEIKICM